MEQVHFLQIVDNRKQSPLRLKCIESVKRFVRDDDLYEVVEIQFNEDRRKMIREVDTIKLTKASQVANLCYIDTDVFVEKPIYEFDLVSDVPYFGRYAYHDRYQMPDIYYFFVNNCIDYFAKHLSIDKLNPNGYSLQLNALHELKNYQFIDDMSHIHNYTTMTEDVFYQKLADMERVLAAKDLELLTFRNHIKQMNLSLQTFDQMYRSA